jgi:protein-tyrosine phosphatase
METGFYDIHTHILPGVDDGSKSPEESREMLQMAYDQGVRHIVATPHFSVHGKNHPVDELKKKQELLQEYAAEIDPQFTIDLGNELLNEPGMVEELRSGRALTMAGTRYILVEFLPSDKYHTLYHSLHEYIMAGYIPIVAHMERYEALYKDYDHIDELSRMGCYFQMNAESLVGGILQRKAAYHRRLVMEGYIQFMGSDCHSSKYRTPIMKDALRYLGHNREAERVLEKIVSGYPETMLSDKYID